MPVLHEVTHQFTCTSRTMCAFRPNLRRVILWHNLGALQYLFYIFFFQRTNKSSCAFVHQSRWTLTMIHSKKSSKHLVMSRLLNALTIPFKLDLDCVLSTAHRTEIKSATKIGLFVKRLWSLYICEMTAFHMHKWAVYFKSCIHTFWWEKELCCSALLAR